MFFLSKMRSLDDIDSPDEIGGCHVMSTGRLYLLGPRASAHTRSSLQYNIAGSFLSQCPGRADSGETRTDYDHVRLHLMHVCVYAAHAQMVRVQAIAV